MQELISKLLSVITMCLFFDSVAIAAGDPCYDVGAAGTCSLFDDVIVQDGAARGLIKVAMKKDIRMDTQFGYYDLKGELKKSEADNTYIYLDSDGKSHIFHFNSLKLPLGIVEKERSSIKKNICKMYGGISASDGNVCYMDGPVEGTDSGWFYSDLKQFGMYPKWHNKTERTVEGTKTTSAVNAHYEFLPEIEYDDFDISEWGFSYDGREIINPDVFQNLQIKDLDSVKDYLRNYVLLKFATAGLVVNRFACASSTIRVQKGFLQYDDFFPCAVQYYDPKKDTKFDVNIGFLFDDVAETKKNTAQAGESMLACAAQGGSGTSKGVCGGFTEDMCNLMYTENGIETKWDPERGGCVMKAQRKHANNQMVKTFAVSAAGVIVGVLTIPVTGGGSTMAIVAIIGGVATVVGTIVSATANVIMDSRFSAALLAANNCLVTECGGIKPSGTSKGIQLGNSSCDCASEAVQKLAEAMIQYEGVFTEQDANAALFLIEALMYAESGTLYSVCLEEIADNVDKSGWQDVAKISDAVALVGVVLSVPTWFHQGASAAATVGDTLKSKFVATTGAKTVLSTLSSIGKLSKIMDKVRKASNTALSGLKNVVNAADKSGKKMNALADKILTIDNGNALMQAWGEVCPSRGFPCGSTVTSFVNDFDSMCGVM